METRQLAATTRRIYDRELTRMSNLKVSYDKPKSIPALFKKLMQVYKRNKVPYENFRLALFALRDHYARAGKKTSKKVAEFFDKDNLTELRNKYVEVTGAGDHETVNPTTYIDWINIVRKTRPFVEDVENDPYDRLLVALYTFIPPRRSDYWCMVWGEPGDGRVNTLSRDGMMKLNDYKTVKSYGAYEVDLTHEGSFHGDREARIFRDIIDNIAPEEREGRVFKTRGGGGYTMVSFATKVKQLMSRIIGHNVSIVDLRRAFDNYIRQRLSSPSVPMALREEYRKLLSAATAHSRAMSDYYADKVDVTASDPTEERKEES